MGKHKHICNSHIKLDTHTGTYQYVANCLWIKTCNCYDPMRDGSSYVWEGEHLWKIFCYNHQKCSKHRHYH